MRTVTAAFAALAAAVAGVNAWPTESGPRVIELTIHNSLFDTSTVTVRRGELVEFVVHNTDPIAHELIVGPHEVQVRHERGTEALHGARPGEVALPAGATRATTYRATTQRPVQFACHLPGHYAYGMRGVVRVLDAATS